MVAALFSRSLSSMPSHCLTEKSSIPGPQANAYFGEYLSSSYNASIVAVGASRYDGDIGGSTGLVQVFSRSNNDHDDSPSWVQMGSDIEGDDRWQYLTANALSDDGTVLAVGGMGNLFVRGLVRVYNFVNNDWETKGDIIFGEKLGNRFGSVLALSGDGNTLAVSTPMGGEEVEIYGHEDIASGTWRGQVELFGWNAATGIWVNYGRPLLGNENYTSFGTALSLSQDGRTVAVGAPDSDENGPSTGTVHVFQFQDDSATFVPVGQAIQGVDDFDQFGHAVSLSADGHIVTFAARGGFDTSQGKVIVFRLVNGVWLQLGQEVEEVGGWDELRFAASLSGDGTILAVGRPSAGWDTTSDEGCFRVYYLNEMARDNTTTWEQIGNDVCGRQDRDRLGSAVLVSRDGSTVFVGADAQQEEEREGYVLAFNVNENNCGTQSPTATPTTMPPTTTPIIASNPPRSIILTPTSAPASGSRTSRHCAAQMTGMMGFVMTATIIVLLFV